jgi:hypothetical protein
MFDARVPIEIVLGNGSIYVRAIGSTVFVLAHAVHRRYSNAWYGYEFVIPEDYIEISFEEKDFVAFRRDIRPRYKGAWSYAVSVPQKISTYG